MDSKKFGLALEIDTAGRITRVLHNQLNSAISEQKLFTSLLTEDQFAAGMDFLQRLDAAEVLFDVPLSIDLDSSNGCLYFSGVKTGQRHIVIAARNLGIDADLYEEIAAINNSLANQLRDAVKRSVQGGEGSQSRFEEFSKLNNELINTQRALNKSNARLAELNERKNELIGVAAHDLRNPLGVISGYIKFILGTGDNLQESQRQMLHKAIETADKMTGMLESLLDLSEVESGKVTLNLSQVDFVKLLRENIGLNQVIADEKDIRLDMTSPASLPVTVDVLKIEQAIDNFISNAIKYSPRKATVNVTLALAGDFIRLAVRDEGRGIPAGEISQVFAPYTTTSVKSTAGERSTGLGLAITRQVIEAHGGTIGVSSEVGSGTEFYFCLPPAAQGSRGS